MKNNQLTNNRWMKLLLVGLFLLTLNSAYLVSFGSPNLFYIGNVLLHISLGLVLTITSVLLLIHWWPTYSRKHFGFWRFGHLLLVIAIVSGVWLMIVGGTRPNRWLLLTHIITASLSVLFLLS